MNVVVKARRKYQYGGLSERCAQSILARWADAYPLSDEFMAYMNMDHKTGLYDVSIYTDRTDWQIAKFAMRIATTAGQDVLFLANIF